jgi:hypothetical protein
MRQRGRRSAASNIVHLAASEPRPKLTPCKPLSKTEQKVFNLIVEENRHLRPIDTPLLTGYAVACAGMFTLKDPIAFDKISRVALALARSLEISPKARLHSSELKRTYRDQADSTVHRPWDRNNA